MTTNVIFAGVGGQGVLLSCRILLQAALHEGYDVKGSEIHGMAQRGGSVDCHVRFGDAVASPIIRKGKADFLVCFELLEAAQKLPYLAGGGWLLSSDLRINPVSGEIGGMSYPEHVAEWLTATVPNVAVFATHAALKEASIPQRSLNMFMLGALSKHLSIPKDAWEKALQNSIKPQHLKSNLMAFSLGAHAE